MTVALKPCLGLDVDGVLLDYLTGFFQFMRSRGHEVVGEPDEVDDWSFSRSFPGCQHPALLDEIFAFSQTAEFGQLEPYPGAVEAVKTLKSHFGGDVRLVAITSAGTSDETQRLRRANLEAFDFDEIHILPLGGSKSDHLAQLPRGSVFVDDLLSHVQEADRQGHHGVLFKRPYSGTHTCEITCWDEGQHLIRKLLQGAAEPAPA